MTATTRKRQRRRLYGIAVIAAIGLIAAACGGSSKKNATGATTSTTAASTETTAPGTQQAQQPAAATTSTTAFTGSVSSGGSSNTTVKKATATTVRRNTSLTTAPGNKTVGSATQGITNVTSAPSTAPSKNVEPGGTVTWLKAAEQLGWDPVNISGAGTADGPAGFMIFDVLVYSDNGVVKPQTADSLTSADGQVWTLKLKPNIKFTDGTPYDAAAVKFNWQRIADPNNKAQRAAQAQLISTMDAVDAVTLRITLKSKNAVFPQAVVLLAYVGSPTAIQKQGAADFNSNPVGAGPFIQKQWVRDSQQVLVRNPNYWNAPLPYLDQVILKPVVDETQRNNTFCVGQANMTLVLAVTNADQLQKQNCGAIKPFTANGGVVLYFNTTKPPMNDPRLRQAVSLAIDLKDYSKVVDNGLIPPMTSIFDTSSPFYDPSILQPTYDPVKAQQLFDQVFADTGGTINIPMSTFALVNYQNTAQYLQAVLNKFNHVKVDVTSEAAPQHVTSCAGRQYTGICVFANFFTDPEPGWTGNYICAATSSPTGYCNPKFDADVADNQLTLDPNKRIADLKDAQKIFYADLPAFFLEQRNTWMFIAPNIQDFQYVNDGLPLFDRLWIKSR